MGQVRESISILLADDDEDDVYLFKEAVTAFPGLHLKVAQNGKQALTCLNEVPLPDLVILDINMPQMSGLECLRYLQSEITTGKFAVIIFSTSGAEDNITQAQELGAKAYVKKPMSYQRYWELIDLILKENWSAPHLPFRTYL